MDMVAATVMCNTKDKIIEDYTYGYLHKLKLKKIPKIDESLDILELSNAVLEAFSIMKENELIVTGFLLQMEIVIMEQSKYIKELEKNKE